MKWNYVTAAYNCPQGCGAQEQLAATLSWPYLYVALLSSVAWGLRLAVAPVGLTWFRALGVLAWGLLALILAGFPLSLFFIATEPRSCRVCGATMFFCGRYFTSARRPRWSDYALLAIFSVINGVAWSALEI